MPPEATTQMVSDMWFLLPKAWASESSSLIPVLLLGPLALPLVLAGWSESKPKDRAHFACRLVWGPGKSAPALPSAPVLAFGFGQGAHLPSAWGCSAPKATLQPSGLSEGKAASNTGPAGLRTHLTRPAFSPETAAFRYCFHAIAFSFMSPMNAFPFAVLPGGGSPQGRGPSLTHTLEVLSTQTPGSPVQVSTHGGRGCVSCWPPSARRVAWRPLGSEVGSYSQSPESSFCSSGPRLETRSEAPVCCPPREPRTDLLKDCSPF